METKNSERREFLKLSLTLGALTACGLGSCSDGDQQVPESGDKVKLLSPEGEIVEVDSSHLKPVPDEMLAMSTDPREGIPGKKFVMVIDLAKCKNLRRCHDACESLHYLPPDKEWLKVLKMRNHANGDPYWQPTNCFHCDRPPCVKVCPVNATFKRSDGIVFIDTQRCIGCRFCMVACPYGARSFNWSEPEIPEQIYEQHHHSPESIIPRIGTVSKCDFCPNMARKGELPHCVTACPNGVYYFGDENEDAVTNGAETVRFSELIRDRAGYRYMEDLGIEPRVYYLPPVDRLFPFEDDEESVNF